MLLSRSITFYVKIQFKPRHFDYQKHKIGRKHALSIVSFPRHISVWTNCPKTEKVQETLKIQQTITLQPTEYMIRFPLVLRAMELYERPLFLVFYQPSLQSGPRRQVPVVPTHSSSDWAWLPPPSSFFRMIRNRSRSKLIVIEDQKWLLGDLSPVISVTNNWKEEILGQASPVLHVIKFHKVWIGKRIEFASYGSSGSNHEDLLHFC